MKKVGLVTCFLNNHGACLQALALQHAIQELDCECEILAYIEPDGYLEDTPQRIFKMAIRSKIRDLLNFFKGKDYTPEKAYLSFYKFRKKHLNFKRKNQFGTVEYFHSVDELNDAADYYDAFVCGSDQIWNPTFYHKNNPVYFLRFAKNKKRIAYAPSIGLPKIPDQYLEEFISYIQDFHSLSVREQKGAEIIEKTCHRSAKIVLDPTLLAGSEFWRSLTKGRYSLPFKEYIFCYIFSNTSTCSTYLKEVQNRTGLPIIYVPISNLSYAELTAYCKKNPSPIDFLQLIKNAKFVLTDSFHGTAFSLLFNKEFYVFKRERDGEDTDMFSRLDNILSLTENENRVSSLKEPFSFKNNIDYCQVNKKLEDLRRDSLKYLRDALLGE